MRKIFFAKSIVKKEDLNESEKAWLLKAWRKGIFEVIKGEFLPKDSKLAKLYMTTVIGPRRAVFLIHVRTGDAFFLMFRSKKDPLGATLKNYLALLSENIMSGEVEIVEI